MQLQYLLYCLRPTCDTNLYTNVKQNKNKEQIKVYIQDQQNYLGVLIVNRLMPVIGGTHVLPDKYRASIDKLLLKFLVPFMPNKNLSCDEIKDKIVKFAAPKSLGGYQIDYITLHMDLLLLKPIMKYFKALTSDNVLPANLYYVEYNIGMQLCNYFKFKVNNRTTHAASPSFIYEYVLKMIKWFKITMKELLEGSVNLIYTI